MSEFNINFIAEKDDISKEIRNIKMLYDVDNVITLSPEHHSTLVAIFQEIIYSTENESINPMVEAADRPPIRRIDNEQENQ